MTCAIVSGPVQFASFVTHNFASVTRDVITGGGRIYLLAFVNGPCDDEQFIDPTDGLVLMATKFFENEASARRWVVHDIVLRGGAVQ